MGLFGAASPKRHKAFTNNRWCSKYNVGKLHVKKFLKDQDPSKKTTEKYQDTEGKTTLQPLNHPSAPAYVWTCSFQPWGSIWECHGITYFRILPSPESYPFIGLNPFRNCLTVSTCGLWLSGI